jgi:hypothetical protein
MFEFGLVAWFKPSSYKRSQYATAFSDDCSCRNFKYDSCQLGILLN